MNELCFGKVKLCWGTSGVLAGVWLSAEMPDGSKPTLTMYNCPTQGLVLGLYKDANKPVKGLDYALSVKGDELCLQQVVNGEVQITPVGKPSNPC